MANATINIINPESFELQDYSSNDQNLVPSYTTSSNFDTVENIVETYIYDVNQSLLDYEPDYRRYRVVQEGNAQGFDVLNSITVDPERDLVDFGFNQGEYNIIYNFFDNKIGSSFNVRYFIKEISPSRQEVRLASNDLTNEEIEASVNEFINERSNSSYFTDFQLNVGNNIQYIANNILLDTSNPNQYTVLIKLYEPLPGNVSLGDTLWICEETAEPLGFNIAFPPEEIIVQEGVSLRGPNLNIDIRDQVNNSTGLVDFNSLTTTVLTSSFNQLNTLYEEKGLEINVDYTDFSEFIHFSSAEQRIRNFYYKVGLIEAYQNDINSILTITGSTSASAVVTGSIATLEGQISDIIQNFDGFDYYMYYESTSVAYPKSNTEAPYILQSTGSAEVLTWFADRITSASDYDNANQDALVYTIPEYLRDDPQNAPYELFIEMVGQHFDNLYLYTKDITNLHDADNRLDYGVSKDLVADALRSFGIKLYQNNFASDDLYTAYLGINASGSFLPPTGSEVIDNYITASNDPTPLDDVNKEIYKRIYHNLPYLLKRKGTVEGVRALINCYGIPDTILRISEFGGKDRDNTDDYDYWYNRYNLALDCKGTSRIITPWTSSVEFGPQASRKQAPRTIMFRFKTDGPPPSTHLTQSLFAIGPEEETQSVNKFSLRLVYTGSVDLPYTSGSYSGSIPSQSSEYGDLIFRHDDNIDTITLNGPFFNGGWWSVMVQTGSFRGGTTNMQMFVKQNIYNGNDGDQIGYEISQSVNNSPPINYWDSARRAYWGTLIGEAGMLPNNRLFSGSLQEIRYYNETISESVFNDFVMNPTSIEGNNLTGSGDSFSTLMFRAPLGNELRQGGNDYILPLSASSTSTVNIYLTSSHPAVTASADSLITASFGDGFSMYTASLNAYSSLGYTGSHLIPYTETYYLDQPVAGIKNRITNKIRNEGVVLPADQNPTLSPFRSIQQFDRENESYTRDVNLLEVAFSPQNEINDDIIAGLGYFNIGEYIGDPRQVSESVTSYPNLDSLRDEYFEKYYKSYDFTDYIRLIKFFDNSLFKMIKDFVPARTGLTTGVVIKQHLLERNKYKQPQMSYTQPEYSASIETAFINGGAGGVFNPNNILEEAGGFQLESNLTSIGSSFVDLLGDSDSSDVNSAVDVVFLPGSPNQVAVTKAFNTGVLFQLDVDVATGNSGTLTVRVVSSVRGVLVSKSESYSAGSLTIILTPNIDLFPGELISFEGKTNSATEVLDGMGIFFGDDLASTAQNSAPTSQQVWKETLIGPSGSTFRFHTSQDEFYNGELSGSTLLVTDGELNDENTFKYPSTVEISYDIIFYTSSVTPLNVFNNINTSPDQGEIYLWYDTGSILDTGEGQGGGSEYESPLGL